MRDKDKYIPGEEREDPPIGLYKIVKTGGGTPKIKFDDPYGEGKKAPQAEEEAAGDDTGQSPPENSAQAAEEKEIEFLRAERAVLEQMIKAAAGPLWEDEEELEEDGEEKEHRKPSTR